MERYAMLMSLGCAKNLVDSEAMVAQLTAMGYAMTSDPSEASLLLVNTCGFLESAVEEAIESILRMAEHKATGVCECLVAVGCMVQRYGKKLLDLLPEVDLFVGTSHYHALGELLSARSQGSSRRLYIAPPRHQPTCRTARVRSTGPGSAYVKIAEGCSNRCSFCMIPHLRGPYRSRTVEDVLEEISLIAKDGVREINLIAQDTTAFGMDRSENQALVRLLEGLETLEGIEWVRLLYGYPDRITDLLMQTMARSRKVLPYLDLPFQHSSPRILKEMGREGLGMHVEDLIARMRRHVPEITLRTSLIVGFPSETEAEFEDLLAFVERVQLDHVGVFAFSPEAGARAARLPLQVDRETKERRRATLLDLQRGISRRRLERRVGQIVPVLVEGMHPESDFLLTGRMASQAPEVDGSVIITCGTGREGEIMPARILAAHDYDVEAELISPAGADQKFPREASRVEDRPRDP